MGKNVTLDDIANALNLSISTVSRALNGQSRISPQTKKRILKKARQLGYSTNSIASALASGRSNMVGIIVPLIDKSFFSKVIRGIESMLKENGYRVIISQSHESVEDEKKCIKMLLEARVDGVLASHTMQTKDFTHFRQIIDHKIPLILFDRYSETLDSHVVAIDDFKDAYRTVEHLIDQGCTKIAYIGGPKQVHIFNQRLKGYKEALLNHNLEVNENLIVEHDTQIVSARKLTEGLLKVSPMPDAIFSTSDYGAIGAIQTLKKNDIIIPDQIAVAGFSNEELSEYIMPSLTTTDQHGNEMGRVAAKIFLNQVNDNKITVAQKMTLSTDLIVRKSTLKIE